MSDRVTVLIIAAGQGTRMQSSTPKVLHPLCGMPMILWPVSAALDAGADEVIVVEGPDRVLDAHLPEGVRTAVQRRPLGTADAVRAGGKHADAGTVVVLSGDVPLVSAGLIADLLEGHTRSSAAATMVTTQLDDPAGYGRVVRSSDGAIERVVETKHTAGLSDDELAIREVNTGIFAFEAAALRAALDRVAPDEGTGEYYLPEVLPLLRSKGASIHAYGADDPAITLGVNDRVDLARVREIAQRRIHEAHMRAGVTIVDPRSTLIDVDVEIAADAVIEPACFLRGATRVGSGSHVGPLTTLIDSTLGDSVMVAHSYLNECEVRSGASVGPFAYLRPGTVLEEGVKAGTFVEMKNARVGRGTKVPHLSYIGDADIGERTNLGAGTITANYDGRSKHRTSIGSDVKGGVDTSFVAPVNVGDGAWTAAGSVVTEDVPADALAVARARQHNIEGYADKQRSKEK